MDKETIKAWLENRYETHNEVDGIEYCGPMIKSNFIEDISDCLTDIGPKWVSVDDELPHPDRCVDLWCKISGGYNQGDESRVENVFYNSELRYWWYLDDNSDHTVMRGVEITHWMPLPEPPT